MEQDYIEWDPVGGDYSIPKRLDDEIVLGDYNLKRYDLEWMDEEYEDNL